MLALALVLAPLAAAAHKTNLSTSAIEVRGRDVSYVLTVSAHDLAVAVGIETDLIAPLPRAEFEGRAAAIDGYIRQRLTIHGDDRVCPPDPIAIDYARLPQDLIFRLTFRCPAAFDRLLVSYLVFFDIDANHRGIGVIDTGTGREQFLFDPAITEIEVEVAAPLSPKPFLERATRFTVLGIEHIATGYDHLLFLIALLIVSARFLHLVKVVTAFTLAHSITLSLAWFEIVDLPSRLVESLIALTIAYVAAENLFGRGFNRRWMLAFGFGLVHGLGFYAVLRELDLGGGGAITPLFSFNLGVEIGQLAVVAVFFPLLAWAFSRAWYGRAMQTASLAIFAVAGFWFVQRTFLV